MTHRTAIYFRLLSVLTTSHFWSLCNQLCRFLQDKWQKASFFFALRPWPPFWNHTMHLFHRSIVWSWLMIWIRKYNENLHQNLVVVKYKWVKFQCLVNCHLVYCVWTCCNISSYPQTGKQIKHDNFRHIHTHTHACTCTHTHTLLLFLLTSTLSSSLFWQQAARTVKGAVIWVWRYQGTLKACGGSWSP